MKTPTPTSVLSSSHYKIAAYDASAFLLASYDVGGRQLRAPTRPRRSFRSVVPVIIVASLACAIAILAFAAANADTVQTSNNAVVIRYSDKIAFGVAQAGHNGKAAEAAIRTLTIPKSRRTLVDFGTPQQFFPTFRAFSLAKSAALTPATEMLACPRTLDCRSQSLYP